MIMKSPTSEASKANGTVEFGEEVGWVDPGEALTYAVAGKPWFVVPALGPPPGEVVSVELPGAVTTPARR